jgi:hypothetical protein
MDFIQLLHQALELTNKKAKTQGMFSLNTRKERGGLRPKHQAAPI